MRSLKSWKITGFRVSWAYPEADRDRTFGVQVNVTIQEAPGRAVLIRLTPDQADAFAAKLSEEAATARRKTTEWANRNR